MIFTDPDFCLAKLTDLECYPLQCYTLAIPLTLRLTEGCHSAQESTDNLPSHYPLITFPCLNFYPIVNQPQVTKYSALFIFQLCLVIKSLAHLKVQLSSTEQKTTKA